MNQTTSHKGLTRHVARSWNEAVDGLSTFWSTDPRPPFETEIVLTSSVGAGKMAAQSLAAANANGICAGVQFCTIDQFRADLSRTAGLTEQRRDPWRIRSLTFAIADVLELMVSRPDFAVVAHHLGERHDVAHPGRWLATSHRFARMLLAYMHRCPPMVRAWVSGEPVDPEGEPLPPDAMWQFELMRELASSTKIPDPASRTHLLAAAAAGTHRIHLFAPVAMDALQHEFVAELAVTRTVEAWIIEPHAAASRTLEVHASHGPARQVGVLRDALCAAFESDRTLESRDVVVFCTDLSAYAPHLHAAFDPAGLDAHPGRSLRMQIAGSQGLRNDVLDVLNVLLAIPQSRALAADLVNFCAMGPVSRRFGLDADDHARVAELLTAVGVRWGIDHAHRSRAFGLDVPQNTWMTGIDQLLAGIAMPGGDLDWIGMALPSDALSSSDVEVVGVLAEIVSRIRRFVHASSTPLRMHIWTDLLRESIGLLADISHENTWMMQQAHEQLADLESQAGDSGQAVSRAELAGIFSSLVVRQSGRTSFGNGSLIVTDLGDLAHVPHKVICLLGLDTELHRDNHGDLLAGATEQPADGHLTALAACTERAIVIHRGFDESTGLAEPAPVQLSVLVAEAESSGWRVLKARQHSLAPHGASEFSPDDPFSFDTSLAELRHRKLPSPSFEPAETTRPTRVSIDELVAFMRDPLAVHLMQVLGRVASPSEASPTTLPLTPDALEMWSIGNRLLASTERGLTPDAAVQAEWRRGTLGPGSFGAATLELTSDAFDIGAAAAALRSAPATRHTISVLVADTEVHGTVTSHSDGLVHSSYSRPLGKPLVTAWVALVAAAASGVPVTHATVLGKQGRGARHHVRTDLAAPSQERAHELLTDLVGLYIEGLGTPVPLPLPIGIRLAELTRSRPISTRQAREQSVKMWSSVRPTEPLLRFYPTLDDLVAVPARCGDGSRVVELATTVYGPMLGARTEVAR